MLITTKDHENGFTLIEVLISVLILGIGILGVLNLQSRALMDNQDAYVRTQAIFLAYDMSDRIRANVLYWGTISVATDAVIASNVIKANAETTPFTLVNHPKCSAYDASAVLVTPTCSSSLAGAEDMAEYDLYRWTTDVKNILPGGSVNITRVDDPNTTATGAADAIIRLTVSWNRINQDIAAKISATASYFLDVRP